MQVLKVTGDFEEEKKVVVFFYGSGQNVALFVLSVFVLPSGVACYIMLLSGILGKSITCMQIHNSIITSDGFCTSS